ncbi:hypothetical protein PMI15_04683 [Polaromonas sp. CF318]|uniref:hypothetical protein n=1 Tax=Polaromonas sp. CF318 TaxID=1144318 RepID=UPI0002714520|nr:hypothetical protein [Polaromonas sp. CF318]EJL77361.1 hypothetical protein PMI15_04683 [Polaromonas sp. CF318]
MTTYAWPSTRAFVPQQADLWLQNTDIVERSVLGGGQQTSGQPGAHWQMAMMFPEDKSVNRQLLLGFLRKLNGKEHRVSLWDMRKFGVADAQGVPAGTITTTGVAVKTTVAQFGISVVFKGCGAGATLLAGDMFSINGQLIENCELATANGSGEMTVLIPSRLRAQALADAPVTLIKPTALFVLSDVFHAPRSSAMYEPFTIEFEEVFA